VKDGEGGAVAVMSLQRLITKTDNQPTKTINNAFLPVLHAMNYLEHIREIILHALEHEDVSVALFGSHVHGTAGRTSDVDVAIIPHGSIDPSRLSLLRDELEESNIPYKVEVVDFSLVSRSFREFALQGAQWWRQ
jgi:predicted nucleotidyltransferase